MKNEKLLNILMIVAIVAVGFFLMQQCQGKGKDAVVAPPKQNDKLVPPPAATTPAPAPAAATEPATATAPATSTSPATSTAPAAATAPATVPVTGFLATKPESVTLGNATDPNGPWLEVKANNVGACIDQVLANVSKYKQEVGKSDPLILMHAEPDAPKPFSVQNTGEIVGAEFRGKKISPAAEVWEITERSPTHVVFHLPVYASGKDRLTNGTVTYDIYRRIEISPQSYEVSITNTVKNRTSREITVRIDQLTSQSLDDDSKQADYRYAHAAKYMSVGKYVEGKKGPHEFHAALAKAESTPLGEFNGKTERLLWTAQANRFFTIIVRPLPIVGSTKTLPLADTAATIPEVDWVGAAEADTLKPYHPSIEKSAVGILWVGAPVDIAAGVSVDLPLRAYFGPKDRNILAGNVNAAAGSDDYLLYRMQYSSVIKYGQGWPCAWLTYDWLVKAILMLLDGIHYLVHNYGVAIIILVIVVRLLLHPLTRMSQVHMAVMQKKMAAIQPEIQRIKKKYEKDKKTQNQEVMRVHRENNVNPAGGLLGCLPMLIQMPIWLALYAGLAAEISLRHAPFIPGWINDLSNPDTLAVFHLSFHLPMLGTVQSNGAETFELNILPLLLGVLFFVQMRIQLASTPKPDPSNEQAMQAAQTQKFTQWMILLFPLFLYHAPSGLNLYIFASTLGGIFDTWLIRKSLRAKGILPAPLTSPM